MGFRSDSRRTISSSSASKSGTARKDTGLRAQGGGGGTDASSQQPAAARRHQADSRTVLGVEDSLHRGQRRRALDSCAPFCPRKSSRRAAPPRTRSKPVSFVSPRREQMEVDK